MINFLAGIFILLHGLVHLWYVVLSKRLVEFTPDMGWSGQSWLLSGTLGEGSTLQLAGILYIVATIGFIVGSIGIFLQAEWLKVLLIGASILSTFIILIFWDGNFSMIVQKGFLGLLINLLIVAYLVFHS
jgi:hypothetical protein